MDDLSKYVLPDETAKQFKLAPKTPAIFVTREHGEIDISTLTPEKAKALFDSGCEHVLLADTADSVDSATGGDASKTAAKVAVVK